MRKGPFEAQWTWAVWCIGIAIDFSNKQAGICIGPWAGWVHYGKTVAEQFVDDVKKSREPMPVKE